MMTSIFLPLTPPFALISSTAIPEAFLNLSPKGASGPVMGWGAPILSVSCAAAGRAAPINRTATTSPKTRDRRIIASSIRFGLPTTRQANSRVAVEALSRPRELDAGQPRAFDEGPKLPAGGGPRARDHAAVRAGEEVLGIDVRQRLQDPRGDQLRSFDLLGAHVDDSQQYVLASRLREDRHVDSGGRAFQRDLIDPCLAQERERDALLAPFRVLLLPGQHARDAVAVADVDGRRCRHACDGRLECAYPPGLDLVEVDVEAGLVELDHIGARRGQVAGLAVQERGEAHREAFLVALVVLVQRRV